MAKHFTPVLSLAVVVALALAAVFGSMSMAKSAQADDHDDTMTIYENRAERYNLNGLFTAADFRARGSAAVTITAPSPDPSTGALDATALALVYRDKDGAEISGGSLASTNYSHTTIDLQHGALEGGYTSRTVDVTITVQHGDADADPPVPTAANPLDVEKVLRVIVMPSKAASLAEDADGDAVGLPAETLYTEYTSNINVKAAFEDGYGSGKIEGFLVATLPVAPAADAEDTRTYTFKEPADLVDDDTINDTNSLAEEANVYADGVLKLTGRTESSAETSHVVTAICRATAVDTYEPCMTIADSPAPIGTTTLNLAMVAESMQVERSDMQISPVDVMILGSATVAAADIVAAFDDSNVTGAGMVTGYRLGSSHAETVVFVQMMPDNSIQLEGIDRGNTIVTVEAVDGLEANNTNITFVVRVRAADAVDPDEGSTPAMVDAANPLTAPSLTTNSMGTIAEADVMAAFTAGTGTGEITGYSASSSNGSVVLATYVPGTGVQLNAFNAGGALVTITAHDSHGGADPSITLVVTVREPDAVVVEAPFELRTPMGSTTDPMSVAYSFTASSDEPGDGARYDIKFSVDNEIDTLNDELEIKMEDFGFPSSMSTGSIGITINEEDGFSQDRQFSPEAVVVGSDKLTITIGDMLTRDDAREDFRISAGSNIDIVIRQSAGITNPTEAHTGDKYGPKVTLGTQTIDGRENEAAFPGMQLNVPHVVKLSEEDGGIGDSVVAEGLGFKNGTTLHFFVDRNRNNVLDTNEDVICSVASVGGDDVGSCEFVVSSPTFQGGDNYVNAVDGRNNNDVNEDDDQKFELTPSLTATPAGGSPGELILIQLTTFPSNVAVSRVSIGGRNLDKNAFSGSVGSQGTGTFSITVPNWAVPGKQQLKVWAGNADADTNITIGGPRITVTPTSVLANQRISLVGTGFSSSAEIARVSSGMTQVSKITISGEEIAWSRINAGEPVDVDSGGNWSASVDLPLSDATTGAGERIIRVTDSGGRTGSITVNIPDRTVTITPESGRVGTIAVVRGTGFPSKNDEGSSFNVEIIYDAGNDKTTTVSSVPDASGRFEAQLRIPSTAAIPSSNQVTVTFEDDDDRSIPTSVTHEVPEAEIDLSASSGGPGTQLTITGIGFKAFVPVNLVRIGTVDITPAPKPTTDGNGMVTFNVVIPGLDVGIQTIEMEVGRTTASIGFTVTESGINPGDIVAIADGVEDLGDNLVSVWHFNNDTKVWSFYDPTLEEGNTLTHMITGETYLIRVKTDVEVILNRDTRSLTCVGGNCWNQIVW